MLTLIDPSGEDIELKDEVSLSNYLEISHTHWLKGSGDSAIWKNDTEALIFFKLTQDSYFLMELSTYLAPIQNYEKVNWMTHFIGGDPFYFSSRFICSKGTVIKVLLEYSKTGEKHRDFQWADPVPDEEMYLELQNRDSFKC